MDFRRFVIETLKQMVDGNVPAYQVRQYAAAYYDKGVLVDADMAEIDALTTIPEVAPGEATDPALPPVEGVID